MLKRNRFVFISVILVGFLIFNSCCNEPRGASFTVGCELRNKDNIQSDKIKIHTFEVERLDFKTGETTEIIEALENVPCSLRSESISGGEILAYGNSRDDGEVSFGLLENKKEVKKKACYCLLDFEEQSAKSEEGKLDFYIIINDPELPDYDDKYATIRLPCPYGANRDIVYLGKKN